MSKFSDENPTLFSFICIYGAAVMFHIVANSNRTIKIENKLEQLSTNSVPVLTIQNTLGGPEPEKFYQFGTNRAYLEVDGKRVDNYLLEELK